VQQYISDQKMNSATGVVIGSRD